MAAIQYTMHPIAAEIFRREKVKHKKFDVGKRNDCIVFVKYVKTYGLQPKVLFVKCVQINPLR